MIKHTRIKRTSTEKREIINKLGNKCVHCGSEEDLTIDHIIPIVHGGLDDMLNFQVLCEKCNHNKSDLINDEPIKVINAESLYIYYTKNSINGSNPYKKNVFLNCFGKESFEHIQNKFILVNQIDKLKEYLYVYKVIFFRNNINDFVRFIPKSRVEDDLVLEYDPIFSLTSDNINHFLKISI